MSALPGSKSTERAALARSWQISDIDEPTSWLPVPRGLDAADRGEWAAEVITALKGEWGEEWHDEYVGPLSLVLDAASADRGDDDGLVYLCWPAPVPVGFAITVNIVNSELVPDWASQGYDVRYYETDRLGPGIQCTAERRGHIAGQDVDLIGAVYVFDDGVSSVVIEVDDVPPKVAPIVNPDLQHFISSLAFTGPDGLPFRAVPSRRLLTGAADRWEFPG